MTHFESLPDIILFTRGPKGDLYPFLRMGSGFKERGCKVTLLSNYCYEEYAHQEEFHFASLDDRESFETINNMPEFHSNIASKLKLYKDHIVANLEKEVKIIESKMSTSNTVIVAHSNDYLAPLLAAEKFNLPLYLCMLAPSYAHGFSLFEMLLKNLAGEINHIRAGIGLAPENDWKKWLRGFEKCFAIWPDWFSGDAQKIIPNLEYVGFLSIDSVEKKPLQEEIRDFIGKDTKNILFTHGTSRPFNDNYFNLGIDVCQKLNCKLIISTPFRDMLPQVLPENVIWVDFCSFHELLPLIDLIVHHGGIGTTRESIANTVPQLIIGQGFDRQHNGRIISGHGLGDWISPHMLTEDFLHNKVNNLLGNLNIKSNCEKFKSFLYSQDGLNSFYEGILGEKTARSFDEADSVTINRNAATEFKQNASYERKNENIEQASTKSNLGINRQELLLKMLKDKAKEAKAKKDMLEVSGDN